MPENFPVQLIVSWSCVMVFFVIILVVLQGMFFFFTLSMSHVIKEKTLALLTLCENLRGYGSETIVHHFLQ